MMIASKLFVFCVLFVMSSLVHCVARQNVELHSQQNKLEYGVGVSAQFILANKTNPNVNVAVSQISNKNPQGFGLPVYINFFLKSGWGLEYAPTIRYDHVRFLDNSFANNSINEWLIDQHFSALLRLTRNDPSSPVVGFGYSIISTGKSIEGGITFSSNIPGSPITNMTEIDFQFSGWHFLARWDLNDWGLLIEPKVLFVSGGKISYLPNSNLTIMSVVSLKYALSRLGRTTQKA